MTSKKIEKTYRTLDSNKGHFLKYVFCISCFNNQKIFQDRIRLTIWILK